jgi:hypothetical protein
VHLFGSIQQQKESSISLNTFKAASCLLSLELMVRELWGAKAL